MNQYERANAVNKIEGYDLRLTTGVPSSREEEFAAAKAACLYHLRRQLEHVEILSFEQYISARRERTPA